MKGTRLRVRERRLRNGMLVLAVERRSHPVVCSMVWYGVGSRDERTGETGLSHFLEHMMFKGTRRLAKGEIDLITSKLGGSNNAFTDYDYTAYFFNFARDRWETGFAIEAERMRGCRLDPAEFEREKRVVLEELRMGEDDPWRDLGESVSSSIFQAHPYHHPVIGWKADLVALPRERMVGYYRRHYAPGRAVAVVAGDVSAAEVFAAAERHFAKIPSAGAPRDRAIPEPAQRGERRVRIERDTAARRLMVGFRGVACGSDDDYALDLLAAALSTGRASRLHRSLVKRRELATHVSAENEARREPGVFWVTVEARDGVREEAVERALFGELEAVARRGLAPRELDRARRMILAGQALTLESASDVADRLGRMAILRDWRYVLRYLERLRRVTPREVRAAAGRVLAPSRRTVGWSAPKPNDRAGGARRGAVAPRARFAAGRRLVADRPVARGRFRIPPRRGALPAVRLPFHREELDNGLVLLVARNASAPTVAVTAFVDIGLACESERLAGIEHLTGSCLEEGTGRFRGDEIANAVEELGGYLESGSRGIHASGLADGLPTILEITASCLREPAFPREAVARVRGEILSEILADEDDLRTRAYRALREAVYGRHPLHRPAEGYARTVRRLRREDAVAFHRAWYAPSRTILAIAGDVNPKETARLVRRHFGRWRAEARPHPDPGLVPAPRAREVRVRVPREQVHLALGHAGIRRTNPDFYALLVMDHVLGTGPGFTDRISRRLRDELGLTYGVSANITGTAGREPGIFSCYLSTEPKNAAVARREMLGVLRRAVEAPPTEAEVRIAKDYLIGSYPFALERNTHRAHALVQMERYRLGADYFESYPRRIEGIAAAEVARVTRAYLKPEACVAVSVGP